MYGLKPVPLCLSASSRAIFLQGSIFSIISFLWFAALFSARLQYRPLNSVAISLHRSARMGATSLESLSFSILTDRDLCALVGVYQ